METNLDSGKKKRVLIVEDEAPLANALRLKLNAAGIEAVVVENGEEALQKLESESFNLIVLDLVMPRVDGFHVLEKKKEMGNDTPVIIASNLSQVEDQQKVKELGAVDYFIKSNVSLNSLVEQINKYIT